MLRYIRTRCKNCRSENCPTRPIGSWCTDYEGCEREVAGIDGDKYFYYMFELRPELLQQGGAADKGLWMELENFLWYIDNQPKGERFR